MAAGVYVRFGAVPVSVPCAGLVPIVYVSGSLSGSVATSVIDFGVSSFVVTLCEFATGGSLTAITLIDTVAAPDRFVPSDARNVKLSGPL